MDQAAAQVKEVGLGKRVPLGSFEDGKQETYFVHVRRLVYSYPIMNCISYITPYDAHTDAGAGQAASQPQERRSPC